MRVVIVGTPLERDRLRVDLGTAGVEIVGEAPTLAAARDLGDDADAFILPSREADGPPAGHDADDPDLGSGFREPLTPREIEVLRLVAEGLSNRAIADRLGISDQTAKFHVASILGKLGAANRTDALRRALRRGVIDL